MIWLSKAASLEEAFLYFADCQAATLENLACKKRSPKSELLRQHDICIKMLETAGRFKLDAKEIQHIHERIESAMAMRHDVFPDA